MRSDKQQAPESYLHRVLADGAKPFRYRSGPRSLLGIPDSEGGNLEFSPTLPPVGFRLINHTFMGEPHVIKTLPNEVGRIALYNDQESELEGSREFPRKNVEQNVANVPIEETRIEIPDFPEKKTSFPPLSSGKKGDTSSDKTETLSSVKKDGTPSGKTEDRSQQEFSPAASRQNFIKKRSSKTENNKPLISPTINTGYPSERLQEKAIVEKRPVLKSLPGLENQVTGNVGAVRAEGKFAMKHELFSQGGNSSPVGIEKKGKFSPYRASSASGRIGLDTVNRSSVDAGETIERLRHAVHDLIVKKSEQQTRPPNETQPHQPERIPPPASQQVVIIKRSSHRTGISCAFWERSYLSRFHFRTLR